MSKGFLLHASERVMKRPQIIFSLAALMIFSMSVVSNAAPVELGKVNWNRDYEATLAAAKESQKPVLILFQEVPG